MNILTKFIVPCRLATHARNTVFKNFNNLPISFVKVILLKDYTRNMAQKTITSFFVAKPPKANNVSVLTTKIKEEKAEEHIDKSKDKSQSPISNGLEKRSSKRQRLDSSDSEPDSTPNKSRKSPTTSSSEKKKIKRQRIESSSSESESPKPDIEKTIKLEKTNSPKTYQSPKSKKTKVSVLTVMKNGVTMSKQKKIKEESNSEDDSKIKKSSKKETVAAKKETKQTKIKKEQSDSEEDGKSKKSPKKETDVKKETEVLEKVSESEYNPAKSKYHPIKDACWAKGEAVPYLALAKTLEAIEATSARLKMVEILANFLRSVIVLTPEDLLACIYMCLNQLAPAYHSLELGIAETYLMKAIGQSTGRTVAQMRAAARQCGDLGAVAEQARSTQLLMFAPPPLRARKVFAALKEIAHMTGHASVNKKIAKIQSLYVACRHSEARYLIRSLEGKLRIGLAEQSVLQALAQATAMTPPLPGPDGVPILDASKGLAPDKFKSIVEEHALIIKTTYCECPNYEMIVPVLLSSGVAALPDHCRLTPGIPLKPMLAHPTKGVHEVFDRFEGEQFTCEWKYDGERAQIHVPSLGSDADSTKPDLNNAAIFSRNQENNTSKYPDILRRLPALLKDDVTSCVLDCEAVAYDTENKQILPFQVLSTRKRKDANESEIKVQVCVFVFDLLYLNGAPLVREPLATRRDLLRKHFNELEGAWQFATSKDCSCMEEVSQFLEEAVRGSCEGLMVKTLAGDHARYDIARRSHNWLKLKKDYLEGCGDTIDAVVIGAYRGKGKRAGAFGGFLLACLEPHADEYQSLCKIGTGFTDDDLQNLTKQLEEHVIEAPRNYYRYDASHCPDVWLSAVCVWEVRCADLSLSPSHHAAIGLVDPDKGISLRFPRFIRVRDDKSPEQATSAQQIAELYLSQDQVINQANKTIKHDDFY